MTPTNYVYLFGYLRRRSRRWGLPKGAPFVVCVTSFGDTLEERREANKYARILEAGTGYYAEVLWSSEPGLEKFGKVFYHSWFFN